MGPKTSLNKPGFSVITGNDPVVIVHYIEGIPGGRSLDMSAFTAKVINAGHIIIYEEAEKTYRPLPTAANVYVTLPAGHAYVGVLKTSLLADEAMAPIMIRGTVNEIASPFPVTKEIKDALPHIIFTQD